MGNQPITPTLNLEGQDIMLDLSGKGDTLKAVSDISYAATGMGLRVIKIRNPPHNNKWGYHKEAFQIHTIIYSKTPVNRTRINRNPGYPKCLRKSQIQKIIQYCTARK